MNLNLVDLSKSIKTVYKGQFNDIMLRINSTWGTNVDTDLLDRESEIDMENAELERLKYILGTNNTDFIGEIAKEAGVSVDKVQMILSSLINIPVQFNKKGGCEMRESLQIGDKIEINNQGDGLTNNYSGLLNNSGIIKVLRTKISDLEKLLKEKDALIASQQGTIAAQSETIELLKGC